jgi:hypothetical protein
MRVLVLDTGPLYDYVAATSAYESGAPLPMNAVFRGRRDLDDFRAFLAQHHRLVTVPAVAAELSNLARSHCNAVVAATMWKHFVALMVEVRIRERHERAIDLDDDAAEYGPVDVALCKIAREERAKQHHVLVLTKEQRNIARWMARSESDVETPHQVLLRLRQA